MMKRLRGLVGNVYTNYKADLATNTNPVVLYTVPDKVQAIIKSIRVSDDSAAGSTITVTITDVANAVFSLGKDIVVGAAVPVELLTEPSNTKKESLPIQKALPLDSTAECNPIAPHADPS